MISTSCEVGCGGLVLTFCLREPVERPLPEDALISVWVVDGALSIVLSPEDRPTPESTRLTRFREGCCFESWVCIVLYVSAWTPFCNVSVPVCCLGCSGVMSRCSVNLAWPRSDETHGRKFVCTDCMDEEVQ